MTASYNGLPVPSNGAGITYSNGRYQVPDNPIVPFIEGDGTGRDIWKASVRVFDAAVEKAYRGKRRVAWYEIFAGEKAKAKFNNWLPDDSVNAIREFRVAIKGPLTTPVGGGIRSLNVALRQLLDLYACVRPVKYYKGTPSPVKNPERMNVVIYRENTEDVYCCIEFKGGSDKARKVISLLKEMGYDVLPSSGVGIKPISPEGTKRLVRMAIRYALDKKLPSVTLMHKGNIMKFTEGAFKDWGYELARAEFRNQVVTEDEVTKGAAAKGKLLIKDRIADSMFQQIQLRPDEYSVIATPNLNGDYLSDAAAAMTGGIGLAAGANIGDRAAMFEATHGTAPKYTGKNMANPGAVLLSGVLMLEHLSWGEAAQLVNKALEATFAESEATAAKGPGGKLHVTYDIARQFAGYGEKAGASSSAFGERIIHHLGA